MGGVGCLTRGQRQPERTVFMLALKFYRIDEGIPRIYGRFVAIVVG
jgi:hypothetical protein